MAMKKAPYPWSRRLPMVVSVPISTPVFERYSQLPQDRNLLVDDVPGQAVGRDAQGQHAAQDIVFFENRDGKSLDGQKPGAGQAGRPAAHHGHFLFPVLLFFLGSR
jgi:hypothetical protein